MNKEIKNTNVIDWLLAGLGTLFLLGGYVALRYGFGLDLSPNELTGAEKTLIYVVSVIFAILYIILIENISRWTKLLITYNGERTYNKKHKDGFPVNEDLPGYKLIEANRIIIETSNLIESTNDMETFEDVVWYVNMENRQKAYNRLLRNFRKKLNKRYRKAKKKRLQDELDRFKSELDINRVHLGWTNEMLSSIIARNRESVIDIDTELYELYDIKCNEYDPQVLLDNEYDGLNSIFDKIRNSRAWYVITTWIFPILLGVSFVILGFMYSWSFDEILSDSDKILLNLLIVYLVTKVPTTIYKAMRNYTPVLVRPKLQSAYVFKRYIERTNNTPKPSA